MPLIRDGSARVMMTESTISPPLWLLAEVTYKCPLHCVFCYNPVDHKKYQTELSTNDWLRVLDEARSAGSVQVGFSGGEPLLREDLETIIEHAKKIGFYTNLITSGVGLTEKRISAFKSVGLDHIQLSFQDSTKEINDFLSHTKTYDLKHKIARLIKQYGYPMVLNCVIHKLNIDHIDKIISMANDLGAEYLELANSQYYSWAYENRDHLLPTSEQLIAAENVTNDWKEKLKGKMRIFFVVPDYHENKPKKCMNGWGNVFLTVTPDGVALPCHTARMLPGITFPKVNEMSISDIWYQSDAFNKYRGTSWMKEPCVSCDKRDEDLGGCRCQAYMLSGDATNPDPVCVKSSHHFVVEEAVKNANSCISPAKPIIFRQ